MNTKSILCSFMLSVLLIIACSDDDIIQTNSICPEIIFLSNSEEFDNDYYTINSVSLSESQELEVNISYSGGCEDHFIELFQDPLFCGTPPVYISIKLSHNANGDMCEALITEDLCFDISSIYAGYGTDDITIGLYNSHQTETTWILE